MSDIKDYARIVRRMREGQEAYLQLAKKPNATLDSKAAALKTAHTREDAVDRRTTAIIDGQFGLFK